MTLKLLEMAGLVPVAGVANVNAVFPMLVRVANARAVRALMADWGRREVQAGLGKRRVPIRRTSWPFSSAARMSPPGVIQRAEEVDRFANKGGPPSPESKAEPCGVPATVPENR